MSAASPTTIRGGILPIVADLATTDETAWMRSIEATQAGSNLESINKNRGDVEVGFNMAKAGTGIHPSVPPGPGIDGCGCIRLSAAKAGVPINAIAIAVASFFIKPPGTPKSSYHVAVPGVVAVRTQ